MSRKTVLPDVREVAEGAQQVLKGIEADGEYERLRVAALASTEVSFAGFPLISRWDAARDCGPLFTEALRAVALRASVLVLTIDDEASHLAVPAPVDAMVHVVLAQGALVWRLAESNLLSLVHRSNRENHAYRTGCCTHACYREAWGDPPARYWLDQQEADRRLADMNERYESIGLRPGGRGHSFDFPLTVGGTR
ncbi:hypothetical protein AB8O64_01135 [Streptomyces sp. QH1-20]|uniref:hypothetical protein n=1 Tax=Streptomyces sp. QH1-20 TaxID=3240934 RepID=UPI0035166EB1